VDLSTAAAGENQKRDDDNPDAVVVIKKIAEAVIHDISSVSECLREGVFPFSLP
jgi:hypothetical protein